MTPAAETLLGPLPLMPVLIAWTGVMISVPLVARRGENGRRRAITIGVYAQAILVIVYLTSLWPRAITLRAILFVPLLGWFAEFLGSRTGIPFGRYHYTEALQPQIFRVPLIIPLAWLMMLPPAWAVADAILPQGPAWITAIIAAAAFTAWDLFLDPHLVRWRFWQWEDRGRFYLEIPLTNFLGWFGWAWFITILVEPLSLQGTPLLLVYVLTWLFQFGGHMVFWKMPVSGLVGFFAMGLPAVAALWSLLNH